MFLYYVCASEAQFPGKWVADAIEKIEINPQEADELRGLIQSSKTWWMIRRLEEVPNNRREGVIEKVKNLPHVFHLDMYTFVSLIYYVGKIPESEMDDVIQKAEKVLHNIPRTNFEDLIVIMSATPKEQRDYMVDIMNLERSGALDPHSSIPNMVGFISIVLQGIPEEKRNILIKEALEKFQERPKEKQNLYNLMTLLQDVGGYYR